MDVESGNQPIKIPFISKVEQMIKGYMDGVHKSYHRMSQVATLVGSIGGCGNWSSVGLEEQELVSFIGLEKIGIQ